MEKRKFIVQIEDQGTRVDLYLAKYNNDMTRTNIKTLIQSDNVMINGNIEYRANYRLKENDEIVMQMKEKEYVDLPQAEDITLDIVYEDEDLVVINKPYNMVVHPGSGHFTGTIVNALLYHYRQMNEFSDKVRAGLIHRIDKDTSGLLMIAKSNTALSYYTKQFAERNVLKEYLAVSTGGIPQDLRIKGKTIVQNFLGRSPRNRQKYSIVQDGGKFAHTEIYYKGTTDKYHLFIADIKTGRTHQIRVHLSSLGLPVLGDIKYGRAKYDRLMLHAWKIRIKTLKGEEKEFIAKPTKEFYELFPNLDEINTETKNK